MDFFLSVMDFFPVCHGPHRAVVSSGSIGNNTNKARRHTVEM